MFSCAVDITVYLYALYVLVRYVTNVDPVTREERLLRIFACMQMREKGGGRMENDCT